MFAAAVVSDLWDPRDERRPTLLLVEGNRHCVYQIGRYDSRCVTDTVDAYPIDLVVPADGPMCQPGTVELQPSPSEVGADRRAPHTEHTRRQSSSSSSVSKGRSARSPEVLRHC
jgi:hypothetical protein